MILPFVLLLGVAIGWATGGRLANLASVRLHGESALVAVVFATALAPRAFEYAAERWHLALLVVWAVMLTILLWLCWINVRTPGVALLGAGLLANYAVILANGGMPVSEWAVRVAGGGTETTARLAESTFHLPAQGTLLTWLGDVLPLPGLGLVLSVGDVLMFLGVVVAIVWGMRATDFESA